MKNANLCIFGHKITGLAYFKPIRYLLYVPYGSSIAALVFIMTLAAGPRGASSSNFFSKSAILQTAHWHVLSLKIIVFPYLELLRLQKNFSWDMHNFFSRLHLNLWALGIKHPKEVFFLEPTTLKNTDLHFFGLKITILAQYELIRQLVKVPHGITIAYSVFILTLTAGPIGASPSKPLLNNVCPEEN